MSTVDNMCVLHGLINHLLNNNIKLYTVFVDYTKAFDFCCKIYNLVQAFKNWGAG